MRDGGILTLFKLIDTATPGDMPKEQLVAVAKSYYSYVQVGVTRQYAALGANRAFDTVVRCHNLERLPDDVAYAILEDGLQYRIDTTRAIVDEDALELTLVRLGTNYDVIEESTTNP